MTNPTQAFHYLKSIRHNGNSMKHANVHAKHWNTLCRQSTFFP